jgi:hypothetical protein
MKRHLFALAGLALLTSCASTGPTMQLTESSDVNPAHLVITRSNSLVAALDRASVEINGVPECKLMPGAVCAIDVPSGLTTVAVAMWSDTGESRLTWQTMPGATYGVSLHPGPLGPFFLGAATGAVLGGAVGGIGGTAAHAVGAGIGADLGATVADGGDSMLRVDIVSVTGGKQS